LVGDDDLETLWREHVEDSLSLLVAHRWRGDESLVDIGSGAGFPALPLKIVHAALRVTLVEADRKKAGFLQHTAGVLGLTGVEVVARRAEEVARAAEHREHYDLATSRAAAAPAVVLEYALPFLRIGGVLLAQVGAIAREPLAPVSARLGGGEPALLPAGRPGRFVLRVVKQAATPPGYPRRVGVARRRPLG
jgi:16S rRNA (guanine527-N7)-methyltransferase